MADKNMILSADAEEKFLKPIDEYVGKIQAQIDELRVDGSDKVRSLKNHIAIAKEDKNLSKEEKDSISQRIRQPWRRQRQLRQPTRIRLQSLSLTQRDTLKSIMTASTTAR